MPWTADRYPPAMRSLPAHVRLKAIEIANAVLAEDLDEGKAIRIGIARAKQWATSRRGPWTVPLAAARRHGDEP